MRLSDYAIFFPTCHLSVGQTQFRHWTVDHINTTAFLEKSSWSNSVGKGIPIEWWWDLVLRWEYSEGCVLNTDVQRCPFLVISNEYYYSVGILALWLYHLSPHSVYFSFSWRLLSIQRLYLKQAAIHFPQKSFSVQNLFSPLYEYCFFPPLWPNTESIYLANLKGTTPWDFLVIHPGLVEQGSPPAECPLLDSQCCVHL